jgi:hypothetical protein
MFSNFDVGVAAGDARTARGTAAEPFALGDQVCAARAVDQLIDAKAADAPFVGGIHHRIAHKVEDRAALSKKAVEQSI